VIQALVTKEIDGGTVFEAEILNYSKKGKDISNIKVITRTPQIPFDAFVAQASIPDSISEKVTEALIKYKYLKGKLTEKNNLKCWVEPNDSLYNSVREAMKFIKDYREKTVKILKFGMCPRRGAEKELKKLKPFISYLEKETGYKIVIKLSPNYLDVGRRLLVGDVDFAILSPFTYIQTADNTKIKPVILAQQSIHNTTSYRSIIVSKKYDTLEKLKGKTLALVDPDSASGRLIPTAYFQKNGINLTKYFGKIYYAGSHLKALNDLISDKTDVLAMALAQP
jgi:phosphate/phosphite/phosphonate ABC transporter binding protein